MGYIDSICFDPKFLQKEGSVFCKLCDYVNLNRNELSSKCIYLNEPILVNFELTKRMIDSRCGCTKTYITSYGPKFYNHEITYHDLIILSNEGRFTSENLCLSLKKDMLDYIKTDCGCNKK